jgi:HlyD family secretion protein
MKQYYLLGIAIIAYSCASRLPQPDAYGNFEAEEILVSAESSGKLISFNVQKGDTLQAGAVIGIIDTAQLISRKQQLHANLEAILSEWQGEDSSLATLIEQKRNALSQKQKIAALLPLGAVTNKQLDGINGKIENIEIQIRVRAQTLAMYKAALQSRIQPLLVEIEQIEELKQKCFVRSPIKGTILATFVQLGEMVTTGKLILKIANLNPMVLRAYISGDQLSQVYLGQIVNIEIGAKVAEKEKLTGKISRIANKAEFIAPKIIETKQEKKRLAHALKILVPNNNGKLKMGMPGEVWFIPNSAPTKNTMAE